jgi:hypothetical protein
MPTWEEEPCVLNQLASAANDAIEQTYAWASAAMALIPVRTKYTLDLLASPSITKLF